MALLEVSTSPIIICHWRNLNESIMNEMRKSEVSMQEKEVTESLDAFRSPAKEVVIRTCVWVVRK